MLPKWCTMAITVVRPAMRESRGTLVPDWSHPTRHVVRGCSVQTATTSMDLDGRTQTELSGTVYAPTGSDIKAGDRIGCRLGNFVVDGEPFEWVSPTGRTSHLQARIVAWRG